MMLLVYTMACMVLCTSYVHWLFPPLSVCLPSGAVMVQYIGQPIPIPTVVYLCRNARRRKMNLHPCKFFFRDLHRCRQFFFQPAPVQALFFQYIFSCSTHVERTTVVQPDWEWPCHLALEADTAVQMRHENQVAGTHQQWSSWKGALDDVITGCKWYYRMVEAGEQIQETNKMSHVCRLCCRDCTGTHKLWKKMSQGMADRWLASSLPGTRVWMNTTHCASYCTVCTKENESWLAFTTGLTNQKETRNKNEWVARLGSCHKWDLQTIETQKRDNESRYEWFFFVTPQIWDLHGCRDVQ